jgi:Galactose oxidase, central domain
MSFGSSGRFLLACAVACLLIPSSLLAFPSARTDSRMVFDPSSGHIVLFGGSTEFDLGTNHAYDLDDTWEWTGARWVELYPSPAPPGRSGHAMTYDTARSQVLMFGGRTGGSSYLNDTWVYKAGVWTKVPTPSAPSPRRYAAAAYDPLRDRTVLYGGSTTAIPPNAFLAVTTNVYDTWEFDGTTWTQRAATEPVLVEPTLTYDATRHEIIMVGTDLKFNTRMYRWDGAAGSWVEITPTTLPRCALFSSMTYEKDSGKVLFTGGLCGSGAINDDTYEWDGSNWTLLVPLATQGLVYGQALAYDEVRQQALMFGGTIPALTTQATPTRSMTLVFVSNAWIPTGTSTTPAPRSRFVFQSDPVHQVIWMYGGLNENDTFFDFWSYANGRWTLLPLSQSTDPTGCTSPAATFDTDRGKLVMVCESSDVFEFDGTAWKEFAASSFKTKPPLRSFSSVAYDPNLKKTVMFGGFDGSNTYFNQTWVWDGAAWSEAKNNRPTSRMLTSLFYDPVQKKLMIYGGIGRLTTLDRITRYGDMWSFDGSGWTKLTAPAAAGVRYGAETAINPATGHVTVIGGIRVDTVNLLDVQTYANDQWEWDGTTWTRINSPAQPPARENTGYEIDPSTNRLVIFAGYAGSYFSDLWQLDPTGWHVLPESAARRRIATSVPLTGATVLPEILPAR